MYIYIQKICLHMYWNEITYVLHENKRLKEHMYLIEIWANS